MKKSTVRTYLDGVCQPNQKIIITSSTSATLQFTKNIPADVYNKYIHDIRDHKDHIDNVVIYFNGFTSKNNKYMKAYVELSYIPTSSDVSVIFNKLHLIMKQYIIDFKIKLLETEYDGITSEYRNLYYEVVEPPVLDDDDETDINQIEDYIKYLETDKGMEALIKDIVG